MNPVVEIGNDKYDNFLIYHNTCENMMINNLFNIKFNYLKDTFLIQNDNNVYEFIKDNENIFRMLEEVKPYLNKYFCNEKYFLEVRCYPEIFEKELTLIIKADYSKKDIKELHDKLMYVKQETNKSKMDLNLMGKFFITMEGL